MRRILKRSLLLPLLVVGLLPVVPAAPAEATPVCTDGYKGGPPLAECGNRIFPEAALAQAYVQYRPNAVGFREYEHGLEFLARKYPRWIRVATLSDLLHDERAVTIGIDKKRAGEKGDTGDGKEIFVIRLTDMEAPHKDKKRLFFSLSVHGNERGGLEGGLRAVEDLAMGAEQGDATISDGVPGYTSATGRKPVFHTRSVREVLRKEDVWLTDVNIDGWTQGDTAPPGLTNTYARGNGGGTDLNRQMPTVGRIDPSRNPLQENEARYLHRFMHKLAKGSPGGLFAYGADIHGELTSRAYVDIMYPAGQFDSVEHRRLMAIAERTKSVIDATLYAGIQDQIENQSGGDTGEGVEEIPCHLGPIGCITAVNNTIPSKPAHWATVWDTLGYTDTGFIGDYLATDLSITAMDYEIFLNHTVPDKAWNVYLQENHINASRAIIKTAMAYALFQDQEFTWSNLRVPTTGQPGYVVDPVAVTDRDKNGPGERPGRLSDGVGADGKKVAQRPYSSSRMRFFTDTSRVLEKPFKAVTSWQVAHDPKALDRLDTLVLADLALPKDAKGRKVDAKRYYANLKSWVKRGGNLVLTDRALHALASLDLVDKAKVKDFTVYQPYTDFQDFSDPLARGLRKNARQLVEAPALGYGIGETASPMTGIDAAAFGDAGGKVVGTTEGYVTLGRLKSGKGQVQVVGGALPTATEDNDHRYGLRDYALTYSGLYVMENALRYDAPGLGAGASRKDDALPALPTTGTAAPALAALVLLVLLVLRALVRRTPAVRLARA